MSLDNFETRLMKLIRRNKWFHGFATVGFDGDDVMRTFGDYESDQLHPLFSMTKSITVWMALLVCEQYGVSVDALVAPTVGQPSFEPPLTVSMCMSMQAGFDWDELAHFNTPENPFWNFINAADPMSYLFSHPMAGEPGTVYHYNSAASHVLAYWIEGITGMSFEAYAETYLFRPLGITAYLWEKDGKGVVYGGHGLHLSLESVIKIARMLVSGGKVMETGDVVLSDFIIKQLQVQTSENIRGDKGYGFGLWHVDILGEKWLGAFGHGGQRLYWEPLSKRAIIFLGAVKPEFGLQEHLIRDYLTP